MDDINRDRRRFFGAAAVIIAAAQLGMAGSASAQASKTGQAQLPPIKPGTNTSFAPLKQIDAGVLKCCIRGSRSARWPARHSSARLALRHLQLCGCCAFVGVGGLPRDRSLSTRLRRNALSFE